MTELAWMEISGHPHQRHIHERAIEETVKEMNLFEYKIFIDKLIMLEAVRLNDQEKTYQSRKKEEKHSSESVMMLMLSCEIGGTVKRLDILQKELSTVELYLEYFEIFKEEIENAQIYEKGVVEVIKSYL